VAFLARDMGAFAAQRSRVVVGQLGAAAAQPGLHLLGESAILALPTPHRLQRRTISVRAQTTLEKMLRGLLVGVDRQLGLGRVAERVAVARPFVRVRTVLRRLSGAAKPYDRQPPALLGQQ
jgi:hypothetical protein